MMDWQTIETAPIGVSLLLYVGHNYDVGHSNDVVDGWMNRWGRDIKPTHWMHLPAAPIIPERVGPQFIEDAGIYPIPMFVTYRID